MLFEAERPTRDESADYPNILLLESGLTPKKNDEGDVSTEPVVRATTQVGQLLHQVEKAKER